MCLRISPPPACPAVLISPYLYLSHNKQLFTSGRLDVYVLVPMLWALYNALPPLLFFVYFFTKGRLLGGLCSVARVLSILLGIGAYY